MGRPLDPDADRSAHQAAEHHRPGYLPCETRSFSSIRAKSASPDFSSCLQISARKAGRSRSWETSVIIATLKQGTGATAIDLGIPPI
jgi:hypothetical protein